MPETSDAPVESEGPTHSRPNGPESGSNNHHGYHYSNGYNNNGNSGYGYEYSGCGHGYSGNGYYYNDSGNSGHGYEYSGCEYRYSGYQQEAMSNNYHQYPNYTPPSNAQYSFSQTYPPAQSSYYSQSPQQAAFTHRPYDSPPPQEWPQASRQPPPPWQPPHGGPQTHTSMQPPGPQTYTSMQAWGPQTYTHQQLHSPAHTFPPPSQPNYDQARPPRSPQFRSTGRFYLHDGAVFNNFGKFVNDGKFESTGYFDNFGEFNNRKNAAVRVAGCLTNQSGAVVHNHGQLQITGTGYLNNLHHFANSEAGDVNLACPMNNHGPFENSDSIDLQSPKQSPTHPQPQTSTDLPACVEKVFGESSAEPSTAQPSLSRPHPREDSDDSDATSGISLGNCPQSGDVLVNDLALGGVTDDCPQFERTIDQILRMCAEELHATRKALHDKLREMRVNITLHTNIDVVITTLGNGTMPAVVACMEQEGCGHRINVEKLVQAVGTFQGQCGTDLLPSDYEAGLACCLWVVIECVMKGYQINQRSQAFQAKQDLLLFEATKYQLWSDIHLVARQFDEAKEKLISKQLESLAGPDYWESEKKFFVTIPAASGVLTRYKENKEHGKTHKSNIRNYIETMLQKKVPSHDASEYTVKVKMVEAFRFLHTHVSGSPTDLTDYHADANCIKNLLWILVEASKKHKQDISCAIELQKKLLAHQPFRPITSNNHYDRTPIYQNSNSAPCSGN